MYRSDGSRVSRDVLAFDDEGFALVLAADKGHLVPAVNLDGFLSVLDVGAAERIVALAPAGGWRVEYAAASPALAGKLHR